MLSLTIISLITSSLIGAKVTIDSYPIILDKLNKNLFPFNKGVTK